MIKIEKRIIEIDDKLFAKEIMSLLERHYALDKSCIAIDFKLFKQELNLKITKLEFLEFCKKEGIELWNSKSVLVSNIFTHSNKRGF